MNWEPNLRSYSTDGIVGACPFCERERTLVKVQKSDAKLAITFLCKDCKAWDYFSGISPKSIRHQDTPERTNHLQYIRNLRSGDTPLCSECGSGHISTAGNPKECRFFSCDKCGFMIDTGDGDL